MQIEKFYNERLKSKTNTILNWFILLLTYFITLQSLYTNRIIKVTLLIGVNYVINSSYIRKRITIKIILNMKIHDTYNDELLYCLLSEFTEWMILKLRELDIEYSQLFSSGVTFLRARINWKEPKVIFFKNTYYIHQCCSADHHFSARSSLNSTFINLQSFLTPFVTLYSHETLTFSRRYNKIVYCATRKKKVHLARVKFHAQAKQGQQSHKINKKKNK